MKLLLKLRLPIVMGNDLAGTVAATGPDVSRFKPGDRIYARVDKTRLGCFAERAVVRDADAAAFPTRLSFEEAASIPLVGLTAWQALVDYSDLRAGQTVLIHAGAGGVGTFAIQLAKHLGARVVTTASAAKAEFLCGLGADQVIVPHRRASCPRGTSW